MKRADVSMMRLNIYWIYLYIFISGNDGIWTAGMQRRTWRAECTECRVTTNMYAIKICMQLSRLSLEEAGVAGGGNQPLFEAVQTPEQKTES